MISLTGTAGAGGRRWRWLPITIKPATVSLPLTLRNQSVLPSQRPDPNRAPRAATRRAGLAWSAKSAARSSAKVTSPAALSADNSPIRWTQPVQLRRRRASQHPTDYRPGLRAAAGIDDQPRAVPTVVPGSSSNHAMRDVGTTPESELVADLRIPSRTRPRHHHGHGHRGLR
jgi:hypothetical protein